MCLPSFHTFDIDARILFVLKSGKGEIQTLTFVSVRAFYTMFKLHIKNFKGIPYPHAKTEPTVREVLSLLSPSPVAGKGSCDITDRVPNSPIIMNTVVFLKYM